MPSYNVRNKETDDIIEVICSWNDLQKMLKENPELEQTLCTPNFVTQHGSTISRAGDGWTDLLKNIKKKSGRNNSINV